MNVDASFGKIGERFSLLFDDWIGVFPHNTARNPARFGLKRIVGLVLRRFPEIGGAFRHFLEVEWHN
jgi:hypothetical protein